MISEIYRRIVWHCRRGMLELDYVLLPYVEAKAPSWSALEYQSFERFLLLPDPILFAWLVDGTEDCDPEWQELVHDIQSHAGFKTL
ncbi:MAG: succinate dehydrogenase assembly factor 2 [Legionellaceae bacterium]|nr:succinate dehydrogenase assembly factor 2 [Legionellaceae bacterium]